LVGVPEADAPLNNGKLNVAGVLGKEGYLTVSKDLGAKRPYSGIVHIQTGEIAEDIAYYLAESEQIPSALGLGVFVDPQGEVSAAGGFIIQALPNPDEEALDRLIRQIKEAPPVTEMIRSGKSPADMLAVIMGGIPYHLVEEKGLSWRCSCNRERIERVLLSLGSDEIEAIIREQGETTVGCEFCRSKYRFSKKDLERLLVRMDSST
jgi:molecular chaperone Hsp33